MERPLQRNCLYEKSINIMTTPKRKEEVIMYKKLMTCLESVRKKIDFKPEVALILGSGLGDFADGIQIEQTIDYTDNRGISGFYCKKDIRDVLCLGMWRKHRL